MKKLTSPTTNEQSAVVPPTIEELMEIPDTHRIYVVAANTVQCPTVLRTGYNPILQDTVRRLQRTEEELITVNQIPGRVMAQGEHVVSLMREYLLRRVIQEALRLNVLPTWSSLFYSSYCKPVTTINLEARDSYELEHVFGLMKRSGIPVHVFHDFDQPDYGSLETRVMTSLCTEPIHPDCLLGITDYLPLWTPLELRA